MIIKYNYGPNRGYDYVIMYKLCNSLGDLNIFKEWIFGS